MHQQPSVNPPWECAAASSYHPTLESWRTASATTQSGCSAVSPVGRINACCFTAEGGEAEQAGVLRHGGSPAAHLHISRAE